MRKGDILMVKEDVEDFWLDPSTLVAVDITDATDPNHVISEKVAWIQIGPKWGAIIKQDDLKKYFIKIGSI